MIKLILQMNQVQSDLRVARSVIAERDAENMRIRSLNNQVITTFVSEKLIKENKM